MSIDSIMDLAWWALAAAPFMIGEFGGGGGGSQPQPPKLDVNQSAELFERQLQLQQKYLPGMVATSGAASRGQDLEAVRFGLGMLTNPSARIFAPQIAALNKENKGVQDQITKLQKQIAPGSASRRKLKAAQVTSIDTQIKNLQQKLGSNKDQLRQYNDPTYTDQQLRKALPQEFAARDSLLGQIGAAQKSSPEYERAQAAMARGLTAQQADMERVQAQETEQSAIGARLMGEAMRKMDQGGQLSPEAQREAVQSARQGFASRGMATGNAAIGAELLNRDRFARQREFENLGFAQGVDANDLARRTQNTLNRQQAGMQNAQAFNQLSQFNTEMRSGTDRFNMGLLDRASQMSDAERARQLGLGQDAYNFSLSTNPRMMLAGLGSPYANMTAPAMSIVGGARGLDPMYSGGSFSSGNQGMNMMAGVAGGALSGAAAGTMINPGLGTAIGAGVGALGGLFGSMR